MQVEKDTRRNAITSSEEAVRLKHLHLLVESSGARRGVSREFNLRRVGPTAEELAFWIGPHGIGRRCLSQVLAVDFHSDSLRV